jgi:hypothetical protein
MKKGMIVSKDDLKMQCSIKFIYFEIFQKAIREARIDADQSAVLVTEATLNTNENRTLSHHKKGFIELEMESNIIFDYERKLIEFCFVSLLNVENESSTNKDPFFYEIPESFFNKKFCENEFTIQN